jgi:hypothetical protein
MARAAAMRAAEVSPSNSCRNVCTAAVQALARSVTADSNSRRRASAKAWANAGWPNQVLRLLSETPHWRAAAAIVLAAKRQATAFSCCRVSLPLWAAILPTPFAARCRSLPRSRPLCH